MRTFLTILFAAAIKVTVAQAANVEPMIAKIKAVGPEGAQSAEAAAAWKQLSEQGADAIVPILVSLKGASPVAANWLQSAANAVVERANAKGQKLPIADITKFMGERTEDARARRIAFELICAADPKAKDEWLPKFIDDPAPELRYEAVQVAFDKVKGAPIDDAAAKTELQRLLKSARHFDQVEAIAKSLEERGEKLDLTVHFGFMKNWQVIGPFDSPDGKGFAHAHPPESKVDVALELPGKTEPVKWKSHTTNEKYGAVDLNPIIGKVKNAVAYAYAEVDSPTDAAVEFRATSPNAIKMFVNGKEVLAREVYHQGMTSDGHIGKGELKKGRNAILLKICQNDERDEEWMFQFRITDPIGAKADIKEVTPMK